LERSGLTAPRRAMETDTKKPGAVTRPGATPHVIFREYRESWAASSEQSTAKPQLVDGLLERPDLRPWFETPSLALVLLTMRAGECGSKQQIALLMLRSALFLARVSKHAARALPQPFLAAPAG
jgi:hypothetical protein